MELSGPVQTCNGFALPLLLFSPHMAYSVKMDFTQTDVCPTGTVKLLSAV